VSAVVVVGPDGTPLASMRWNGEQVQWGGVAVLDGRSAALAYHAAVS